MKYHTANFTMTELLVIITIVCLLAGVILPALSNGINRAKLISCGGNLRNIGNAVHFYCADNSDDIPNIMPGMEVNSIPALRLPNNMKVALGRLPDVYCSDVKIFGCPDSPGYREIDVKNSWYNSAMVWSAYLYRGQSGNFQSQLHHPDNLHKPYVMDFACITNQGEQFAPHNYMAVNLLFPDCHIESQRNTKEPFRLFTAQAALHGEITPDCTLLWQHADK